MADRQPRRPDAIEEWEKSAEEGGAEGRAREREKKDADE